MFSGIVKKFVVFAVTRYAALFPFDKVLEKGGLL